ncbi:MAG: sodium:glutamate symporter [Clostridia bacterium]|nr:sodium:glutamate symporter [Clostridia bacterium]
MDFSSANVSLWSPIIQIGIIAGLILLANVLRQKVPFIRGSLMPTAVLAGFLLLLIRSVGLLNVSTSFLEGITFHAIALGFIALSLRVPEKNANEGVLLAGKNGALIVSTYLVQGIVGLVFSIFLAYTFAPDIFKASGLLLPMAYGQGPGQANNVGSTYEALGMAGGRSFGLSLAAMGYLCACVVGVIYLTILSKRGKVARTNKAESVSGSVTVDTFQDHNEIPISESIDRFSIQAALVCLVYLVTYLLTLGIVKLLEAVAPGLASTVSTLLWGFNFIVGSLIATIVRSIMGKMRKAKIMVRQYQNNYLLSRISGVAFDFMIVAGIASIEITDLKGNVLPFVLMSVFGGVITFLYLKWVCRRLYPNYFYEGFMSMYGMLTGTISSGVLLLREIDPELKTPASNNLITGSSFGIAFGAPVLLIISFAPKSDTAVFISLGILAVYLAALLLFICKAKKKGN